METLIPEKLNPEGNNVGSNNKNFSLSNINFEVIYNNLGKNRIETKKESKNDNINIKRIIFELRCQMRKDLYQLIDSSENNIQSNNIYSRNNNGNILGKKRASDIPLIDLTHISMKEE